jgi:hypothetical protein
MTCILLQVAGALGVDVVMIAPGGLGISFDQVTNP